MMHHLREFGQGYVAKILLGFLVLVFGFWGIGDIFRSGGMNRPVATVGDATISLPAYQQQLHRRIEELTQMLGEGYSPALIKQLHVEHQVLSSMINSRLVEQEATAEGIAIDDRTVAELIRRNPAFAGSDGKFDKTVFVNRLKNEGGTEQQYVEELRNDMKVGLLSDVWSAGGIVPDALIEALYNARAQQRVISIAIFSPDAVGDVPSPSDQELKNYYNEHTKMFVVPEFRTLRLVMLSPEDIAPKIEIADADLVHAYEERKQEFFAPEHRDVEQLIFAKEADAKTAAEKFAHGSSFKEIAAKMHPLNNDKIALGNVSKQQLPAEVADAVFSLKVNTITGPIQTAFGWNLLHVTRIEPEGQQPFEKVRDLLLKDMRGKQAQDTIYQLMNQLQDALAGGESIEVAAQKAGAKIESFAPLNHNAEDEKGTKITLPSYTAVLNAAFSLNEKDNSSPIQADDGGIIIVHVDQVIAEHTKSFDDVKKQVADAWTKEKRRTLLRDKLQAVVAHIHDGKTMAQALQQEHITLSIKSTGVKISHDTNKFTEGDLAKVPVSPMLVNAVFHLAQGQNTDAVPLTDGSYCIAALEKVIAAPDIHKEPNQTILTAVRSELENGLSNDVLESYLKYLRSKYKVSINEDIIQRVQSDEGNQ